MESGQKCPAQHDGDDDEEVTQPPSKQSKAAPLGPACLAAVQARKHKSPPAHKCSSIQAQEAQEATSSFLFE
eukprot:1153687-Pelagomonas_calceolata.AAC.3